MARLTQRQARILEAIRRRIAEHGCSPTMRELVEVSGLRSTSAVVYQLSQLEAAGLIHRQPGLARGIVVVDRGEVPAPAGDRLRVSRVGHIAAGGPIEVPDDRTGCGLAQAIDISGALVQGSRERLFALRVRGYSMVDALINDGDIVVLRHAETAVNGETVAVWLRAERETTLKRFYHEGNRVRLQPANVTMAPLYCDPANVAVQGKLVGVLRHVG